MPELTMTYPQAFVMGVVTGLVFQFLEGVVYAITGKENAFGLDGYAANGLLGGILLLTLLWIWRW